MGDTTSGAEAMLLTAGLCSISVSTAWGMRNGREKGMVERGRDGGGIHAFVRI